MGTLTKRDKDVLNFIKDYMLKNGMTPTIREMSEGVYLSTASVYKHFQHLIDCGEIIKTAEKSFRYSVKGMKYQEKNND